ncbi:hypothetical protein [Gulosibacter macacae]|nr:hypothetical protein [Gulosibacter macacae]
MRESHCPEAAMQARETWTALALLRASVCRGVGRPRALATSQLR